MEIKKYQKSQYRALIVFNFKTKKLEFNLGGCDNEALLLMKEVIIFEIDEQLKHNDEGTVLNTVNN